MAAGRDMARRRLTRLILPMVGIPEVVGMGRHRRRQGSTGRRHRVNTRRREDSIPRRMGMVGSRGGGVIPRGIELELKG